MTAQFSQSEYLTVLTHSPAAAVKQLAEVILETIEDLSVLKNQTGLGMVPYVDSANGTVFHLGEVLVAEAHIKLISGIEGYAMVMGRDNSFAMAIAVLDAAMQSHHRSDEITSFIAEQQAMQAQVDDGLLRKVEATRVEMETF